MVLVKPLYLDPATGQLLQTQNGDVLNVPVVSVLENFATLIHNTDINTCCSLIDQNAVVVTSLGTSDPTFRPLPYVDCIVLEAGIPSDNVRVAQEYGLTYDTTIAIPYNSNGSGTLYLGQNGKPTTTVPSLLNGDLYSVVIGRLKNSNQFIFAPEAPVDLSNPGGGGGSNLPNPMLSPGAYLYDNGTAWVPRLIHQSDIIPTPGISSFNVSPLSAEVGQIIANPSFSASYISTPSSVSLLNSDTNTSETINTFNTFSSIHSYSRSIAGIITFTLTANFDSAKTLDTSIIWLHRIYYGHSTLISAPSELQSSVLASSANASYTITASVGEYTYFAIPYSLSTPTFSVGGVQGGFNFVETVSFTNIYGLSIDYNIYKSDNVSLGTIVVTLQ